MELSCLIMKGMQTALHTQLELRRAGNATEIILDRQGLTFEKFEDLIRALNSGESVTIHNPSRARTSALELGFRLMSWYERVKESV